MDSQQFISDAIKTESRPEQLGLNLGATLQALHVMCAAAALADAMKRSIYYGKGLQTDRLANAMLQLNQSFDRFNAVLPRLEMPESHATTLHVPNLRLLHGALGIFSESGEMIEAIAKQIMTGELDKVNFGEETGDVDWYKAIIHDESGVPEDITREAVIAKLKARYGEKFSSDAATNRDTANERQVLEGALGQ